MTPDEIRALSDRELDVKVARAMGCVGVEFDGADLCCQCNDGDLSHSNLDLYIHHFSTDPAAMLRLLEWGNRDLDGQRHQRIVINIHGVAGEWEVVAIRRGGSWMEGVAFHASLPRAVAEAVAMAMEGA